MKIQDHLGIMVLIVLALVSTGCAVRLVSSYDEETDKGATALHKSFESFFVKAKSRVEPECTYESNRAFYQQAKIDFASLKLRVGAIPKNGKTVEAVDQIGTIIDALEAIHAGRMKETYKCMNLQALGADQTAVNSAFGAILKLELAKKRGEDQ